MKKYYLKYAGLMIIGILADVIVDYVQLLIPEYLGEVVEIVSSGVARTFEAIKPIVISLLIVSFVLLIGRMLMRFGVMQASARMEADLRHDMFKKSERLSQRFYHENKVGTIISWFSSDIEAVEEFTGWGTIMIVDALFLSILAIWKMVRMDLALSLVAIIPMLGLVVWGNQAEKTMSAKWLERQEMFDKLYDFATETFTGIRVIKAFVKEKQEFGAFSRIARENSDKNLEVAKTFIRFDVMIEIIIGSAMAVLMGLGGFFVYRTAIGNPIHVLGYSVNLTAGKLTTFVGYVDALIWPMIAMGQILQMYSKYRTSIGRIHKFLDEEEEIHSPENAVVLPDIKGKITFKDFDFQYPDGTENSLNDISFEILPGEMVGIVGKIGSGKTTLVNSLLRLYNIGKGQIFIDDVDIMDLDIANLRDNVAYVPQDNFLFSDNIRNNIAFSNNHMRLDEIKKAAEFADVHNNILGFEKGYETVTGERGVTLSGGQKQRISIARAYIKDAPIMILDDSVSAVDVKTEETILHNIEEKRKGKTTIIIASRISTVSKADKILVLKDGKVEAFDTPERLLEISPTYQKMSYLQKLESEL